MNDRGMFLLYSKILVLLYFSPFVSVTGCNSEQIVILAERQSSNAGWVLGGLQSEQKKKSDIPRSEFLTQN